VVKALAEAKKYAANNHQKAMIEEYIASCVLISCDSGTALTLSFPGSRAVPLRNTRKALGTG